MAGPRPDSAASGRQAGVTLLELLVGITLFALIMVLLARSESFVLGAWRTGDQEVSRQQQLSGCLAVMLRQVRSAVPFKPPPGRRLVYSFAGRRDRLSFVSAASLAEGGEPGLWLVTYSLAPGGPEGGLLVVEQRPALDRGVWEGEARPVEGVSLLSGVNSLRFRYLELDRRRGRLLPRETWLAGRTPRLPTVVRVEMVVQGRRIDWYLPLACGVR